MEDIYKYEHKLKSARDYESQGKLLHAAQIYRSIIEEAPEQKEAYYSLADLYENSGSVSSGIDLLESLLDLDPADSERRLFLGQYLLRNKYWEKAIDALSYFSPEEEPLAAFFLGYSYYMLNEIEIAKINFLTFLSNKHETDLKYEAFLYLVKIEIALENFENALNFAKRAEPVYFDFWELNFLTAKIYYKLGMFEHAVKPVEKAIKQNPKQPEVYELAGKTYAKQGDYLKAEKKYLKYLELSVQPDSEIYVELAQACFNGNKIKDALKYYEMAIQIDPDNKSAEMGKMKVFTILKNNSSGDV